MTRADRIEKELEEMRKQRSILVQELNSDDELENNESWELKNHEKESIIRKIPGFRSVTWWKMIIAIIGYGLIVAVIIGAILPGAPPSSSPTISSTSNNQGSSPSVASSSATVPALIPTPATSPMASFEPSDDAAFPDMVEGELMFIEEDLQDLNNAINAYDYESIEYYSRVLERKTKGSKDIANAFKISSQRSQLKSDFFAFLDEVNMMAVSSENGAILAQKGQLSSAGANFIDAANHARNINEIYLPRLERQLS